MIARLKGKVVGGGDGYVILESCGVGFQVFMPGPVVEEAAKFPAEVVIYTHLVAREDTMALYGFLSPGELEMFRLLITVNRVGPALATAILSQMTVSDLAAAVIGGDEKALTRVSGVGQKNAGRIILELRDRMKKKAAILIGGQEAGIDPLRSDAESALLALGFSPRESRDAVSEALAGMTHPGVQDVIKASLRILRER